MQIGLGLSITNFRRPVDPFDSPTDFFAEGELGYYLRATPATLFTDTAGTTAVTPGTTAALWLDESGNDTVVQQPDAGERPEYQDDPDRLIIDGDKRLQADVPAIIGTLIIATDDGTAAYGVDISSGDYPVGRNADDFFPGNALFGQVLIDRELTAREIENARQFFIERGAGDNYGNVTDFRDYWRDRDEITQFPVIDTSSGTSFRFAWNDCSSLTSFPQLDVSNGTSFLETWQGCSSLTSFPILDTSSGTSFRSTWRDCSSLTSFPLLDVSSGTDFFNAWRNCSSLTSFPLLDVSNGTDFERAWQGCSSLSSFPLLDVSNGTSFRTAWDDCSSLTSFPQLDVSSGTNFGFSWRNCSSLTSFPLLDVSNGTDFEQAWRGCSSLTTFPPEMFDNVTATLFDDAFDNTNLNEQSIDNILVSIEKANTSNGTFDQSGGSAPSAVGEAAIDALVARGWTVNVTGGYTP